MIRPLAALAVLCLVAPAQDGRVQVVRDAIQPHLAGASDGSFAIAFIQGGDIRVSRSTDDGKTWSEAVTAISNGKAKGGMQRGPRIAIDGKGGLHVTAPLCFDDAEQGQRYPRNELWYASSGDGGKTWSKPVRVNEVEKKAPESLHWMAADADGNAHVVWLDMRDRAKGQDVFYARISDGKVGKNLKIAAEVCECCAPGMAVDRKTGVYVAFREGGGKTSRQIMMTASKNGGKSFGPPGQVNRGETKVAT